MFKISKKLFRRAETQDHHGVLILGIVAVVGIIVFSMVLVLSQKMSMSNSGYAPYSSTTRVFPSSTLSVPSTTIDPCEESFDQNIELCCSQYPSCYDYRCELGSNRPVKPNENCFLDYTEEKTCFWNCPPRPCTDVLVDISNGKDITDAEKNLICQGGCNSETDLFDILPAIREKIAKLCGTELPPPDQPPEEPPVITVDPPVTNIKRCCAQGSDNYCHCSSGTSSGNGGRPLTGDWTCLSGWVENAKCQSSYSPSTGTRWSCVKA